MTAAGIVQFAKRLLEKHYLCANTSYQPRDLLAVLEPGMDMYVSAFTHVSAGPSAAGGGNYEALEFTGDTILNCAMLEYLQQRFPGLAAGAASAGAASAGAGVSATGAEAAAPAPAPVPAPQPAGAVKVLARMKVHVISKDFLSKLAMKHGFDKHVITSASTRVTPSIVEDVFEAFFGCTAQLVNRHVAQGFGYVVCSRMIAHMMDDEYIPTSYETLFDARTRIKELLDVNKHLGKLEFTYTHLPDRNAMHVQCTLLSNPPHTLRTVLAEARGHTKAEAVQAVSEKALQVLKQMGYERPHVDVESLTATVAR
jgi:dsRNA-specific ribonuclease